MLVRIIPISRSFDRYGLTYRVDSEKFPHISPWDIARIPFGKAEDIWICAWPALSDPQTGKEKNIKDILSVFPKEFALSPEELKMIDYISQRYFTLIHQSASLYFPKNLREKLLKNTFWKIKTKEYNYKNREVILSVKQQEIYKKIDISQHKKYLLYGITGSGKTEIYTQIISDCREKWKQVLLLIPEIILTSQIETRMKKYFWDDVIVLHSGVSAAKKTQYWTDIHAGKAQIILGTRSSLFYPYHHLWAIIMDEEHDESYISDQVPRYHSREVAEKLSELYGIPLILASGTPKITSFYKGLRGEYDLLQLLEKYSD